MVSSVGFEEATSAYELEVVVWEDVAEVESNNNNNNNNSAGHRRRCTHTTQWRPA